MFQFKKSIEDILKPGYYLHADSELVKFCFGENFYHIIIIEYNLINLFFEFL